MEEKREGCSETNTLPLYRAWFCGSFRLERRKGLAYTAVDTKEWGGHSSPRTVLKALVCAPRRRASRGTLLAQIWPEADGEQASRDLNVAIYRLHKILYPLEGQACLTTEDHALGFVLADQAVFWVDADAALALLAEAQRIGHDAPEAVPSLEEAWSYFQRGAFLEHDEGEWSANRCAIMERGRYRCRLWLADAYVRQGHLEQAETILNALLGDDPTDEDVICRLMSLLHQRGLTHQALVFYKQISASFTKEGLELTEATRMFATRIAKERHVLPMKRVPSEAMQRPSLDFSSPVTEDSIERSCVMESDGMDQRRRQLLRWGINGTTLALLPHPNLFDFLGGAVLHDEEILSIGSTSLPIFWRLYFDGQFSAIQRALPGYLSQLTFLLKTIDQSSHSHQQAAKLVSKAHQLACMLTLQGQDYGTAFIHVDQALRSARIADDVHLQATSLIRKALVYRYIHRYCKKCPAQIIEAYQAARQYGSALSPLLQGRIYTGLAEAYSELGQEYQAKHALEQAYTIFPAQPQNDPHFSYTHFKLPQGFEAIMYLNLKQAKKAWDILATIDTSLPQGIVPDRVELSIDQTRASLLLGDLKQSCQYLEIAATSATALGSALRSHEANYLYRHMQTLWPHEQSIQAFADLFPSGRKLREDH